MERSWCFILVNSHYVYHLLKAETSSFSVIINSESTLYTSFCYICFALRLLQSIFDVNHMLNTLQILSQLPDVKQLDEWLPGSLPSSSSHPWAAKALFGSCVQEVRVPACEETLQVAPLWQVSIDAIDFKLKWGVRWSIKGVHAGHSCSVMHGLPSPDLMIGHCDRS